MDVNIYIETACRGPAKRRTAGAWIVEYVSRQGKPVTRGGLLYTDMATEKEMCLMLLRQAISILIRTCCVRVFTQCRGILGTMQNHWLVQWKKNGWINAKGKPVKNVYLWEQCADLFEKHVMEWTDEEHSYRNCMMERATKEMDREHELKEPGNYMVIEEPAWNTGKGCGRNA